MRPKIGFVLLTHTGSGQADRLVMRLNAMFNLPPIVWHHDFSKSERDTGHLPQNVVFVRPHLRTEWAQFSVVEGAIRALRQMYRPIRRSRLVRAPERCGLPDQASARHSPGP